MDVETVLYLVFLLIFIISRILKARRKEMEKQQKPAKPVRDHEPAPSQPETKKESTFQDIFSEMMKNLEDEGHRKQAPETKKRKRPVEAPKPEPEKKSFISNEDESKLMEKEGVSAFERSKIQDVLLREGESSLYKPDESDITKGDLLGEVSEDESSGEYFQFDPREAFMLKTLLERRYE